MMTREDAEAQMRYWEEWQLERTRRASMQMNETDKTFGFAIAVCMATIGLLLLGALIK